MKHLSISLALLCAGLVACDDAPSDQNAPPPPEPMDAAPLDMTPPPALPACEADPTRGPIAGICLELWTAMRVRGEGDCDASPFEIGPRPPPPDAALEPPPPADMGIADAGVSPPDAGGPAPDAAPLVDAAVPMPPRSCLNADVRACGCRAEIRGEILRIDEGAPPIGCPLATLWEEAGGEVVHAQIALADDTLGILALRADGLGLRERLSALGSRAPIEISLERNATGGTLARLTSNDDTIALIQAGGSLDSLDISAAERVELSAPQCSDQAQVCAAVAHTLLFQDGNAPYPIPSGAVDELAGWRFAPYRMTTRPMGAECDPDEVHLGILRLP